MQPDKYSLLYEAQNLTFEGVAHILSALKSSNIRNLKVSISSSNEEFINELNLVIKKQSESLSSKRAAYVMLGKDQANIQIAKRKKYKKTIDLSSLLIAGIFVNQYRQRLKALGEEFELAMIWEGSLIKVFSASPISTVFESQIVGMKHRLRWTIVPNERLLMKVKFSKYIRSQLLASKIKILYLFRNSCVLLHSSEIQIQKMKQAAIKFQYEAVILAFENPVFSRLVNRLYFRMLAYHCQPLLNRLAQQYEVICELNKKRMGIIMHLKDPVFEQEPKQELIRFLSKIVYVSYLCKEPVQHIKHFRKSKPRSNSFIFGMSKTFVYSSWNTQKQIKPEEVSLAYKILLQEVNEKTYVRIGFHTGGLSSGQIEQVCELVQKYKLEYQTICTPEKVDNLIHVKFKTFNAFKRDEKILQLSEFLQQLITGRCSLEKYIPASSAQDCNKQIAPDEESQADVEQVHTSHILAQLQTLLKPKQGQPILKFSFEKPQIITSDKYEIKKGKRNHKLIQCRIWNARIESNFLRPNKPPTQAMCEIHPVQERFDFLSEMTIKKPTYLSFRDLKNDQKYHLISQLSYPQEYVITHIIVVYNAQ